MQSRALEVRFLDQSENGHAVLLDINTSYSTEFFHHMHSLYAYIYIYIYTHTHIHTYIYNLLFSPSTGMIARGL